MTVSQTLVDTGILVALYDSGDRYHSQVIEFLSNYRGRLITTLGCVTEVMCLLAPDHLYQDQSGVSLGSRSKPLRVRIHNCQQAYSINKVLTAA